MRRNTVLQSDLPKNARAVFQRKIDGRTTRQGECIIATFQPSTKRPTLVIGRVVMRVHQWAYALYRGSIPAGLNVCHSCDVPRCINPDHLWLGTQADNMRDMAAKGRHSTGGSIPYKFIGPRIPWRIKQARNRNRTRNRNRNRSKQQRPRDRVSVRKPRPDGRGERNPLARITEQQAREILSLRGKVRAPELGRRFGLSRCHIHDIWAGRRWRHLSSTNN